MQKSQAEGKGASLSVTHQQQQQQLIDDDRPIEKPQVTLSKCNVKLAITLIPKMNKEQVNLKIRSISDFFVFLFFSCFRWFQTYLQFVTIYMLTEKSVAAPS